MADTVFVIDDDAAIRRSMRLLFETVGLEAAIFSSAVDFLGTCEPDIAGCVIADIRLPEMSGLELLMELKRRGVHLPVIIITGYGDVPTAVECLKVGAADFFEKPVRPQALLDRVQQVLADHAREREQRSRTQMLRERLGRLTPREREVVDLVVMGKTSVQIARKLSRSPKTIHVHRAEAMAKMDARSVAELGRLVTLATGTNGTNGVHES